jgi:hypothetical protein
MVVHSFDDLTLSDDDVGGSLSPPPIPLAGFTGTSLFTSPLSTAGSPGGGSFGSRGGGVSLVLCEGSSVVCGGIIRGSDEKRFCCKWANKCQVESHKASKVLYQDGALYIRAARADQARAKPVLLVDRIPGNTSLEELIGLRQEVDVWVTYLNTLQEQHEQSVIELDDESTRGGMSIKTASSWAEVNGPGLADLSKARQNINTPR